MKKFINDVRNLTESIEWDEERKLNYLNNDKPLYDVQKFVNTGEFDILFSKLKWTLLNAADQLTSAKKVIETQNPNFKLNTTQTVINDIKELIKHLE